MKSIVLKFIYPLLCLAVGTVYAQKTQEFRVSGNCEMCKERIESTARQAGAIVATYFVEHQKLSLTWEEEKISSDEILKQVAKAGHNNEKYKASDKDYYKLPKCCRYSIGQHEHIGHNHSAEESCSSHKDEEETERKIEDVHLIKTKSATSISKKQAGLVIDINKKELLKSACCNLSESFETNATVDVSFSNAITGAKQLKMLGVDQKYTSITKEHFPEIRGLSTIYGLNFIPGRWVESIHLTKGGSSVTNGYEGITGQINTEFIKYRGKNETAINLFVDENMRTEANLTQVSKISERWGQSILLHINGTFGKRDYNDDGFLDQPTGNQMNIAYLLNYDATESSGWWHHFGVNFFKDERYSGQKDFDKTKPQIEQSAYGVGIQSGRTQIWNNTSYNFPNSSNKSISFMNQYTYYQQDSFFGFRNYGGKQNTYYTNLVYQDIIKGSQHRYKLGTTFLYDTYREKYLTEKMEREEKVLGAYGEYIFMGDKITWVVGARVDFHNLAGTQFSPRINFKYDITKNTILRLSAGRGYRTANIYAENQQYFASNRQVEIHSNGGKIYGLKPEIAWNYGLSLQQEFKLWNRKSSVVVDFFRTDFQDQVIVDLDASTHKILLYNLKGKSYANALQTEWNLIPIKNMELRIAYKYYDINTQYISGLKKVPFMAKHRGFVNIAYTTNKNALGSYWAFDATLNIVGKQRIPSTLGNPSEHRLSAYSNGFHTFNLQVSKNFNDKKRVYLGAENLTSTTQKNPIIDAKNPFGNYFDGGMIYKPIIPISIYCGIDLSF